MDLRFTPIGLNPLWPCLLILQAPAPNPKKYDNSFLRIQ